MGLKDLLRAVDALSDAELEALYAHIRERRSASMDAPGDRPAAGLDIEELKRIFADLRDGFSASDLDDLEWAMTVEVIEPLDDEL